jgi:hypothetical protein
MLPETFFREEVRRPFDYAPASFDCGCIQNDCMSIDREKTLAAYRAVAGENASRLESEIAWCKKLGADVIASDITPFAFEVARHAGIPSVGTSNFTWYDIYLEYLAQFPEYATDVAAIREQYAGATLMCALEPALPMSYFPRRTGMPVVGRKGCNRREEIVRAKGLGPSKHLGLIYFGNFGLDAVDFSALERFTGWEFFGISPLSGNPSNYRCIPKTEFLYQDLIASVDCMICKIGYGAVSECMLHGTPLVYPPRADFAEFPALDAAARAWGGGYCVPADRFLSLDWGPYLDAIIGKGPPKAVPSDGARVCALEIERVAHG